jgi:hypothetical protein
VKSIVVFVISFFFNGVVHYSIFSQIFVTEVLLNALLTPLIFQFLGLFSEALIVKPESRL